jgi:hypothetical protein
MKAVRKLTGVFFLVVALYYWAMGWNAIPHPNDWGIFIVPLILTIIGIYLVTLKSKQT